MTPTPPPTDRLRELLSKATPGPWLVDSHRGQYWNVSDKDAYHLFAGWKDKPNDVLFVVELVNAAPALLKQADRAERLAALLMALECDFVGSVVCAKTLGGDGNPIDRAQWCVICQVKDAALADAEGGT